MIGTRSRCNKEYSRNYTRGLLKHSPHTVEMADGTDTDHYMQPDADNSVEQINSRQPTPAAQNKIYALTLSQIATTTTEIES